MSTQGFGTQNMIRQYTKQILTSRTLAYRQSILKKHSGEQPTILPEAKRRIMVERIAREVFTNLLAIGSDNPMVQEVQATLQQEFGETLRFYYPPGSTEASIYRETPNGTQELSEYERVRATNKAWEVTLRIVDAYMS